VRILVITDAWQPQVNGVVRTLRRTKQEVESMGHEFIVVSPDMFLNVACPTYPEIRLAVLPGRQIGRLLGRWQPSAIHIATEGPLGQAARRYCIRRKLPFSTAYHTRFPEYIQVRTGLPTGLAYGFMRRFHAPARSVMVATSSLQAELEKRGFKNIRRWSRGVDTELFRPGDKSFLRLPRPIHLFVGRIAIEKGIEDFLRLDLTGTKLVVGDGPLLEDLRRKYPNVVFTGAKHGSELAAYYAASDIFVFPSRTDTFGLVLLEALASGLPVAAFPVAGPLDIIDGTGAGALNDDLRQAIQTASTIPAARCREVALTYNWRRSAEQFLGNLIPFE
jgi:glycosyltransferase involved in cell wall biosynthesis